MHHIPPSNLIHERVLDTIDQLPLLNSDTLSHIKTFLCPMIHMREKDYFWYRLARETHNMDQWGNYVTVIVEKRYGLSHPMTKYIFKLRKEFRDPLDHILGMYYDKKERTIHNGYFIPDMAFYGRNKPGGIHHTMVHYNPFTTEESYSRTKLSKTLSSDEKEFVAEFLKRYKAYVDFVETFYRHYDCIVPLYSIIELGNMISDINEILPKLCL